MDNKEAFQLKLKSQLEEWQAEFKKLTAENKAEEAGADFNKLKAETKGAFAEGTIEGSKEYKSLANKIKDAQIKLQKLESAGEDKWNDLKSDIEATWSNLKQEFQSLTNS